MSAETSQLIRPRVYVTRLIPEAGLQIVRAFAQVRVWEGEMPVPREVLLHEVAECDGVLTLVTDKVDEELLAAAPQLQVVSNYAVGYDNINVPACTQRGVLVGNTPGVLTETTADLAFALLLATARRIVEGADYVKAGQWKTWGPLTLLGADIHHATLGIVGLGRIGREMAKRGRGFDMKLLYTGNQPDKQAERDFQGLEFVSKDELLRRSDFISLHLPLNAQTRHYLSDPEFELMKPTAIVINTARGPVIDQAALLRALQKGQIAGAGLDVTDPEPLNYDHALVSLPNVVIVPHIGSASVTARERMGTMAAQNLVAALRGEAMPSCLNPAALEHR